MSTVDPNAPFCLVVFVAVPDYRFPFEWAGALAEQFNRSRLEPEQPHLLDLVDEFGVRRVWDMRDAFAVTAWTADAVASYDAYTNALRGESWRGEG